MAWTTPKTWNVGDVLKSSDMNTYGQNNISFLGYAPNARVYSNANFSVTGGVTTQVQYNQSNYLNNGMTLSSYAIVVPVAGRYWTSMCFAFGGASNNQSAATFLFKNGSGIASGGEGQFITASANALEFGTTDLIQCVANDALQGYIYQNWTGTTSFQSSTLSYMMSVKLSN